MSDYKYNKPPEKENITWLKAKVDAVWEGKGGYGKKIPKDSITWTIDSDIHKDEKKDIVLVENNRHGTNYLLSDFEIIPDPNGEYLLTTIL
jgi:hypothetical protein